MIAVLADEAEHEVVREFFELFKTPWAFYAPNLSHDVLICDRDEIPATSARLVLVYGAGGRAGRPESEASAGQHFSGVVVCGGKRRIPIFGTCSALQTGGVTLLWEENSRAPVACQDTSEGQTIVRFGFDLFREVRRLVTQGQPAAYAALPTLDRHIEIVRDLILYCSIPLVEIPPVPAGHPFIACLTHDVDHPRVRDHKFDHTMFGFLYRAIFGSLGKFCRGRLSFRDLAANWLAAFSLPFVHLGLARDFWNQFDRYLEMENGLTSTFFVIPKQNHPGQNGTGSAPSKRASRYAAPDIATELQRLRAEKREIALHGIEAWRDGREARTELEIIRGLIPENEIGVRMHWLYFDEQSPALLEKAGFSYDSTVGYNETVGYRAGTSQAYKPLAVDRILEVPLHVMDTALFYPDYMNLPLGKGAAAIDPFIENANRSGGVLTINWHDRSLAPERLWGGVYMQVLKTLREANAWFATAMDAVRWFRKRRGATIETVVRDTANFRVKMMMSGEADNLPGLVLRLHRPSQQEADSFDQSALVDHYLDMPVTRSGDFVFAV